jgi:ubiquinone/menaquinone biosynthesis C-methylase UbiE
MEVLTSEKKWDSLSEARKKWEHIVNTFLHPISIAMIGKLSLRSDAHVLDVATGMGEPGLTVASSLIEGHVTGMDISEKMLVIARDNAKVMNIRNFTAVCCEVDVMPFREQSFDAIICRNGMMFFRNMSSSIKEMYRVLKPNGHIAVSTWGLLEKNLWIQIVLKTISEVTRRKSYNKHVPGMFYCMQPGFMTDWFEETDLRNIEEHEITGIVEFGSFEEHWEYVTTVCATVVEAMSNVDVDAKEEIRLLVREQCKTHLINGKLYFQWTSIVTSATKP